VGQNNQEQKCRICYTSLSRDSVPPTRKPYSGDYFQHALRQRLGFAFAQRARQRCENAVATPCGREDARCEEAV